MGQMDGRVLIRPETDSCSKRATSRNERYANGTDMDLKETKVDAKTCHQQNSAGISINKSEKLWAKSLVFKSGQITTSGRTSVWHKIPQSPDTYYRWISTGSASRRQSVSRIAPRRSSMADMAILGTM